MTKPSLIILFTCLAIVAYSQEQYWDNEKIIVQDQNTETQVMSAYQIFEKRWDVLPQAQFWKKIMSLSPDTCIVNIAKNRHVLESISSEQWIYLSKEEKRKFRDSIRSKYELTQK